MIQAFFGNGYGIVVLLLYISMYVVQYNTMVDIKIVEKNKKYDNHFMKMYSLSIMQVTLIIMVLIMPVVLFLINLNWFTVFLCIFYAYTLAIMVLRSHKKLEKNLSNIIKNRKPSENQHYLNNIYIKKYFQSSVIIFVIGLIVLLYLNIQGLFYTETMGDTYGYDLIICVSLIILIKFLTSVAILTSNRVIELENIEHNHLKSIKDIEIDTEKLKECKIKTDIKKKSIE